MYFKYFILLVFLYPIKCDERGARVRRIVGGSPADVPPVDDPVIYTRFNGKSARVHGVRDFPHYVFRGIRFAHPPVGRDRFLRPREKFLEGNINATAFPPPCVQPLPGQDTVVGDEDCLALNIFTPDLPTGTEGFPVVVWIHGGGFRYGSASQYGVRHLVGKRLVVVTMQYRLGSLGFLSTGSKELPGNAALWDMVLAVQWVRNYIGFFGGNPYRIVVMGHGTGASSALLVALSNVAKGMASGIVAMSGTAVSQWATDNTPSNTAHEVAEQNGCPTTSTLTMVKCLQKIPSESIIRGDSNIEFRRLQSGGFVSGLCGRLGSSPVSEGFNDGRSLPGLVEDDPLNDMYKQHNPKIPLLTGITKDETKKAVEGHFKGNILEKLQTVPNFLDKVLVNNLQTFVSRKQHTENVTQENKLLNFRNYLQVKRNNIREGLHKISEATGDALFNVPAFLTAENWKGAPTYLYSFEHIGKLKKGHSFLRGIPIVGNSTTDEMNDTVGHGDDLAYLFEPHDLNGRPLELANPTKDDLKVQNIFTQMIADFAKFGKVNINNEEVQPFSSTKNNFIQIKPKPILAANFRFCEMALWVNLVDRLKSTSCSFLKALDTSVANAQESLFDTINKTKSQVTHVQDKLTGMQSKIIPDNKMTNVNNLGQGLKNINAGILGGSSNLKPKRPFGLGFGLK